MKKVLLLALLFFGLSCASAFAQGFNCGPPTYTCSRSDTAFIPLTSMPTWGNGVNGVNAVNTDPDFQNPVLRASDITYGRGSINKICTGLGGSGDVPNVWNSNSTILLMCDEGGSYFPVGFDPFNFRSLGPLYGTSPRFNSGGGVFSHTNPNMFYALTGGQLYTLDYTNRTTAPIPQLLYDYEASCGVGPTTWQSNGLDDMTDTVFSAAFSTTGGQGTGVIVAAYNKTTGICFNLNTSTGIITQYPGATVVGTLNVPDRFTIHNVKMKGATALVIGYTNCLSQSCGQSPYAWLIGTNGLYVLGSPKGAGHWVTGCSNWINQPGDNYLYDLDRSYINPSAYSTVWGVSQSTCGAAPKVSCSQPFDSHPAWLGDCTDTGNVLMATFVYNSNVLTYPYQNEIVAFSTNGTNKQTRFAHTYSDSTVGIFNAQESIGAPSQDGKFYAWTTQAGGQFGCEDGTNNCTLTNRRNDVLVVKLQ